MIIGYPVPEMWRVTDVIAIFHFFNVGLFFMKDTTDLLDDLTLFPLVGGGHKVPA